tara:strand:- start:9993 stop:11339 length:1347 start_codon:yes stop_codon:yes gene_type:complete
MVKQTILITAPVTSRSGYGNHSRDIALSLIGNDKYDVFINDVPWGSCPRNAIDDMSIENNRKMKQNLIGIKALSQKPDVYIDLRIPNEFEQHGKFNIGMTAGIETNAVSPKWIECCNKMDLIITTSEHSKNGFVQSTYDQLKQLPNGQQEKVGQLRLEKQIEVLFEGADEDVYKKTDVISDDVNNLFSVVKEDFAFLFLGQWTKGGIGEDRKDIPKMVKVFYEAFANKKEQPALVLKTNGATSSIIDKEECLEKLKQVKNMFPLDWKLPNIYLIHGDLTDNEVNELYNHPKIKAMVSFTHGEGFGRPLLEATMCGLPVIASGWSGQLDFLNTSHSLLVQGELKQVPTSQVWKDIIIPESKWFSISENHAYNCFVEMFKYNKDYKEKANQLMEINREKFSLNKMAPELYKMIDENAPKPVSLSLPKLKMDKVSTTEIKLPELSQTITGV